MKAQKIILPKPTAAQVLTQITPFVTDHEHETTFALKFKERRGIADTLVKLAKSGSLTPATILAVMDSNDQALNTLISLLGISQEEFYRHVTLARLHQLRERAQSTEDFGEWKIDKIIREMRRDRAFAGTTLKLLLDGSKDADLARRIPPFLLAKLDGARLATIGAGGIDALIRTGLKGSYDAGKGKPVVHEVELILQSLRVRHIVGELAVPHLSRKFDCLIPHEGEPHILIEVGVFATTARELSEKGLVEQLLRQEVAKHYPDAVLVRILDGVGWIARGGNALQNVVNASHYVFTQKTLIDLPKVIASHVPKKYFL